jgi:sugar phosphate isomerase/epimerase
LKLGVSTASLYPLETELALEEIGKAGIKTAEIFFNAESELKDSFIDILIDIKEKYGMEITAVHPTMSLAESFMIFSGYERRFYESLDEFARYSEIAAELGAKYIILHGGKNNGILTDEEYCERYMRLKEQTLKNNVTILQENVFNHRAGDIEFLRSMQNILKNDAEFCIDIKQSLRCGYSPVELIEEFSPNIRHYHISDNSLAGDCLLPGNGTFNFKDFFKLIKSTGYNGDCIIEVYSNSYHDYSEISDSYKKLIKNI